jgi:hypothetical protein
VPVLRHLKAIEGDGDAGKGADEALAAVVVASRDA